MSDREIQRGLRALVRVGAAGFASLDDDLLVALYRGAEREFVSRGATPNLKQIALAAGAFSVGAGSRLTNAVRQTLKIERESFVPSKIQTSQIVGIDPRDLMRAKDYGRQSCVATVKGMIALRVSLPRAWQIQPDAHTFGWPTWRPETRQDLEADLEAVVYSYSEHHEPLFAAAGLTLARVF